MRDQRIQRLNEKHRFVRGDPNAFAEKKTVHAPRNERAQTRTGGSVRGLATRFGNDAANGKKPISHASRPAIFGNRIAERAKGLSLRRLQNAADGTLSTLFYSCLHVGGFDHPGKSERRLSF